MTIEPIERLRAATDRAVERWMEFAATLKIEDPLLPASPAAKRWALEEDFRLFAEFREPEDETSADENLTISKLIGDWIYDRITREADHDARERRASIIAGDDFFFGPSKVERLIGKPYPKGSLQNVPNLPDEGLLR